MIALVELIKEHGGALNHDLMTRLGAFIEDVPDVVSWRDLMDFIHYLPNDSALFSALHPDIAPWATTAQTNSILANIYDAIAQLSHMYASAHTKKTLPKPKPYPRPFAKDEDEQRLGSDPIPMSEFDDWWNSFDEERDEVTA